MSQTVVVRTDGLQRSYFPVTDKFFSRGEHVLIKTPDSENLMRYLLTPLGKKVQLTLMPVVNIDKVWVRNSELIVRLAPGYYWPQVDKSMIQILSDVLGWKDEEVTVVSYEQWQFEVLSLEEAEVEDPLMDIMKANLYGIEVETIVDDHPPFTGSSYYMFWPPCRVSNQFALFGKVPTEDEPEDFKLYNALSDRAKALVSELLTDCPGIPGVCGVEIGTWAVCIELSPAFDHVRTIEKIVSLIAVIYELPEV